MNILQFLKNWMLPISIAIGASGYLLLSGCEWMNPYKASMLQVIAVAQPVMLFCMLLLSFCRVKVDGLRLMRWHKLLLAFQVAFFLAFLSARLFFIHDETWQVIAESMMLCFICPTATAAVVVTGKLGGNALTLIMYTILINVCVALLIPATAPLLAASGEWELTEFLHDFRLIASRVFPLLVGPMIVAYLLRRFASRFVARMNSYSNAPFYLWSVSLALAIAVSTRSIAHSTCSDWCLLGIGVGSLLACAIQFFVGRRVGRNDSEPIAAGQALGQKNTVLIIWLGYTFFSPITSLAGGFYSIWHNVYNSYQLYRYRKEQGKALD